MFKTEKKANGTKILFFVFCQLSFIVRFLLMTKYPLTIKNSNTAGFDIAHIGSTTNHNFVAKKSGLMVKLRMVCKTNTINIANTRRISALINLEQSIAFLCVSVFIDC